MWMNRPDVVEILLKAGARLNIQGGKEKKTPYELAKELNFSGMELLEKYKELLDWLQELGLEDLMVNFVREEIFKDVLPDVDEAILDKMNITSTGHRLKILKAVSKLKAENNNHANNVERNAGSITKSEADKAAMKTPDAATPEKRKQDEQQVKEERENDLKKELENLKHINSSADNWLINYNEVEYTELLGSGTSGKVFKGLYHGEEVAVKVLKALTEDKEIQEFKKEFQIMR